MRLSGLPSFGCASVVLCALWSVSAAAQRPAAAPDLILHGGKIITVDTRFSIAEAVAIRGDRIVAVGADSAIRSMAGPETRVLELQGRTVLPGLADTHTHPLGAAMYEFDHDVPEMETIADVLDYFRQRSRIVPKGEWIRLQQVFITRLREQRYPTRDELDEAAPDHPVYFRTGPDASLNSLALELSGIDRDFRIPQGSLGRIERDADGNPTGIVRSGAHLIEFRESQRQPSRADKLQRLRELFAAYNRVGLTSIADRNASPEALDLYEDLLSDGHLTVRVFVSHAIDAQNPLEDIEATIAKLVRHPRHRRGPMLWLR